MKTYKTTLRTGINRTKEFERKGLAEFAVNVGVKCGHACKYCSSPTLLRMHRSFAEAGRSPFEQGYSIVDPDTPARVARDARRMRRRGMVQVCTTVDGWSPEARDEDLGRRCVEAILAEPEWTVRILTKSAAVVDDFDLFERHRDRVLVGLSITAPPTKTDVVSVVEPYASPLPDRMAALKKAHERRLRTYAMFCPLLPGIADAPSDINELVQIAVDSHAEEMFVEPVNARGPGLRVTQEALESHGYGREAEAIEGIRRAATWSSYVARVIRDVQRSVRAAYSIDKLRILLYPSRLTPSDLKRIRRDDAGVVWLGRS